MGCLFAKLHRYEDTIHENEQQEAGVLTSKKLTLIKAADAMLGAHQKHDEKAWLFISKAPVFEPLNYFRDHPPPQVSVPFLTTFLATFMVPALGPLSQRRHPLIQCALSITGHTHQQGSNMESDLSAE